MNFIGFSYRNWFFNQYKIITTYFENINKNDIDVIRILNFLITGIKAFIRIKNVVGTGFDFGTGIPQGDSLSPCLWIFHLQFF